MAAGCPADEAAVPSAHVAPPPAASPCARYAEWLCHESSPDAAACNAIHLVVDLLPPAACEAGLADPAFGHAAVAAMKEGCTTLASRVCADIGPTTQTCADYTKQVAGFTPAECFVRLREYDTVLRVQRGKEARRRALSPELQARLAASDAPSIGPQDALVTVVEIADFECPFCAEAASIPTAIAKRGDRVRFVFRHLPLAGHAHADLAAQAAIEAHAQGRFWPFHDALFAHQDQLDRAGLLARARETGLDMTRFVAALDSGSHEREVEADRTLARDAGADSTPTMFVNGMRVANPTDAAAVSAAIDGALASAKAGSP